jgi:hypothetical protein
MNRLELFAGVLDALPPWRGRVPKGYLADFLGVFTDGRFRTMFGVDPETLAQREEQTRALTIADGEGWFEAVNWVMAAREARERFVMVALGACYGGPAVASCRVLQRLNPMPYKLVAVEPEPENCAWIARHMRANGIDPDAQWILPCAVSDRNDPVLFPVGSPGTGAQNCFSTNENASRARFAHELIASGQAAQGLENLLLRNTTGIVKDLAPGHDFMAEIKLMSAVTLRDILAPFEFVDYLDSDIQQSEIIVFPPFLDLLKRKVRRIHIGTHGKDVHRSLHALFQSAQWEIVFSYEPNDTHVSALGDFTINDGVLTVRNPRL